MAPQEKLSSVRAEIERLIGEINNEDHGGLDNYDQEVGFKDALDTLLNYIDSPTEESKNNDLEEEIMKYNNALNLNADMDYSWDDIEANVVLAARHFAEWGKQQMLKEGIEADVRTDVSIDDEYVYVRAYIKKGKLEEGEKVKLLIIKDN